MFEHIIESLKKYPKIMDGKEAILYLKEHNYNWKQMEWSGWFNELWMQLNVPSIKKGRIYGRTKFDGLYNDFDVDFKAHDIEKDTVICNDKNAMYESICQHGKIYLIVSIFKYDKDKDGEFKKWHDELKGKKKFICQKM